LPTNFAMLGGVICRDQARLHAPDQIVVRQIFEAALDTAHRIGRIDGVPDLLQGHQIEPPQEAPHLNLQAVQQRQRGWDRHPKPIGERVRYLGCFLQGCLALVVGHC
jgi:hypothetical protein